MVKEKSHYEFCRSVNDCKMYEDNTYGVNPIYFDEKTQRYICHGLRDAQANGRYLDIEDCKYNIKLLNWELNRGKEMQRIREFAKVRS
jgi:hypothetical protein